VYAVNERQEVEDFFFRWLTVDQSGPAAALSTSAVRYNSVLKLLPGRYRIRALAREEPNGQYGLRVATVDVSDSSAAPVTLTPTFVSSGDSEISIRAPREEGSDSGEPFELAGKPFVPNLPRPRPGNTRSIVSAALSAAARGEGRLRSRGEDLGRKGSRGRSLGISAPRAIRADAEGLVKILAEFTPGNLAPGEYALSVTFSGQGNTHRGTAAGATLRIRPSGSRAEGRLP
jgi:hypothetical protein